MKKIIIWIILVSILCGLFVFFVKKNSKNSVSKKEENTSQNSNAGTPDNTESNNNSLETWLYSKEGHYIFKYPASLETHFINTVNWPPSLSVESKSFSCNVGGEAIKAEGLTKLEKVGDTDFCITSLEQGAAGSIYTDYIYSFKKENQVFSFSFTLREPQCMNYDNPDQTNCINEENTFNLNSLILKISQTVVKK